MNVCKTFFSVFMFLLAALIVKNSLFFIYVIFLKQRLRRLPILNLKLSEKIAKLVIKKQILEFFCKLVALILR